MINMADCEVFYMTLKTLLTGLEYTCLQGSMDIEINNVINDSRKAGEGDLFLCIPGAVVDGHKFAADVAAKGAAALVVEKEVEVPENVTVIKVENARYAMALISAAYFDYPAKKLKVVGVTGTKGKTTTTYMIRSILEKAGHKVGVIGTIEVVIGDEHIAVNNTTPESMDIHYFFDRMVKAGCDVVVMEVSSQGLKLHRTAGIEFDYGMFTNLSPDHIGPNEHESFEEYLYCKSLLFKQCKQGIANMDDSHYAEIVANATCPIETYGVNDSASLKASNVELTRDVDYLGVDFDLEGLMNFRVHVGIPGSFSVYNALGAIAIVRHFGVSEEVINDVLKNMKVKGRVQIVPTGDDYTLIIDYAHNAVSLESILKTMRAYNPPRLVCMFGCGGNRAKSRRYEMGEVSGNMADLTIITSDNPRFEEPQDIINDIITGIEKTEGKYIEIIDRREAISYCMKNAQPGDIVVLAGKGHETYQEIKGVKYHMSEEETVMELLEEMNK